MPRRARMALFGACIGVLLLVVIWYAAHHIGVVRHADAVDPERLRRARIGRGWTGVTNVRSPGLCDPKPLRVPGRDAGAGRASARAAARRGHARADPAVRERDDRAAQAAAGGARAIRLPESRSSAASWPSGHATAAMSLCLCWVIAAPARLASGGGGGDGGVRDRGLLLVPGRSAGTTRRDVLGGFLIATVWTLSGIAALSTVRAAPATPAVADAPVQVLAGRRRWARRPRWRSARSCCSRLIVLARPHAGDRLCAGAHLRS